MKIDSFSFKYGNKVIFRNVSIELSAGLFHLVGSSGSGKSTLLYILHGLLPCKIKRNYTSSLMCQELYFASNCTTTKFMLKSTNRAHEASQYLKTFNINENTLVSHLSLGQKQIVMFITCLLRDADVYLLDEPFANIDSPNRRKMLEILRAVSKDKMVIVASHTKIESAHKLSIRNNNIYQNKKDDELRTKNHKRKFVFTIIPTISKIIASIFFVIVINTMSSNYSLNIKSYSNNEHEIDNLYTESFNNIYDFNSYEDTAVSEGVNINEIMHKKYNVKIGDYLQSFNGEKFIFYEVKNIINDDKITPSIYFPGINKNNYSNASLIGNFYQINKQLNKLKFSTIFSLGFCALMVQILLGELYVKKYLFFALLYGKKTVFANLLLEGVISSVPFLFVAYGFCLVLFNILSIFITYFYLSKRFPKMLRNTA